MFSSQLVNHWFYNLINNKPNNEILLLVLPNLNNYKKKLKESLLKLQVKNYELITIDSITSINKLENNQNTIILGLPRMNINLLNNLQHCVLYSSWEDSYKSFLSNEHIDYIKKFTKKESIAKSNRYMYCYEQRDPMTLLNPLNRFLISDYIIDSSIYSSRNIPFDFITQIFPHMYIHKYDGKRYIDDWKYLISKDISYLSKSNILTARLAIVIYKVTTFKFDDSSTRIGNYYREKLGVKSKTIRLPQNVYHIPDNTTKAYDLNVSNLTSSYP